MSETLNHPWDEVLELAEELATEGHGLYQKFTCGRCGQRLTIEQANTFYTHGRCSECGHVTNIKDTGCNYLLVARQMRDGNRQVTVIDCQESKP